MYSRHFDLQKDPFSIAPDPRFLFMSERHREALAHLLFGVTGTGGFVLFTGDIGTGKTTVCRCFLEQIPAACNVAIVFNPKLSVLELLQTICQEFHIALDALGDKPPSPKFYVDALNAYLLQSHAAGQSNVLIIDEAQNLRPEVLEQLRLLTNLETHERKLLQIILIGQPELRTMLERPELEQLAQRVIARYHLVALNLADTRRYIQHRLTVAGHSGALPFDEKALRRIHALTRGVPRRINLLCGRALLGAWATGIYRVDRSVLDKAASEVFGDAQLGTRSSPSYAAPLLGAGVVLVLAVGWAVQFWPRDAERKTTFDHVQPNAVALASAPAVVPAAPVVPSVAASVVRQPGVQDVENLFARLPSNMLPAWRELATIWHVEIVREDPCQSAALSQLQCYRGNEMSIPALRQLDRPGILTLQGADGAALYAVLTGLDEKTATLRWAGQQQQVSLISLARSWRGDFATFWRPPDGYVADPREGLDNPALGRLSDQLAQLEGRAPRASMAAAQALDAALVARVKAFQKGQGIKPDGHPGPMTYMQIEKALGINKPSLEAPQQ